LKIFSSDNTDNMARSEYVKIGSHSTGLHTGQRNTKEMLVREF